MTVKKVSDKIDSIMVDYSYRVRNGIPVPDFLQKQINAIWAYKDDPDRGVAMLMEGLQMERESIEEVEAQYDV